MTEILNATLTPEEKAVLLAAAALLRRLDREQSGLVIYDEGQYYTSCEDVAERFEQWIAK